MNKDDGDKKMLHDQIVRQHRTNQTVADVTGIVCRPPRGSVIVVDTGMDTACTGSISHDFNQQLSGFAGLNIETSGSNTSGCKYVLMWKNVSLWIQCGCTICYFEA